MTVLIDQTQSSRVAAECESPGRKSRVLQATKRESGRDGTFFLFGAPTSPGNLETLSDRIPHIA